MSRLFLRFYLGVIAILFAAWLIQAVVFRSRAIQNNIPVIEQALSGGARLARDQIVAVDGSDLTATLDYLQLQFGYPIRIVSRADLSLSKEMTQRLDQGDCVLYSNVIETALPNSELLVELGPLPSFGGPTQTEITVGLGSVFLLSALGIAILLRPLVGQLRNVERTALAIAGGDLSARIDSQHWKRSLPLAGAFNSMADRVEQLLRSQKELMQAVSHELRTPLARIKFATELLHSAEDSALRSKRISAIDEATDQLDDLVGELLTYVRLDAETETVEYETVEVGELIEESMEIHAPLYPEIIFTADVPSQLSTIMTFRPGLLRALGNLIGNAGKYSRTQVVVAARENQQQLMITVDDDGPGIAEKDRQAVFEPFKRLSMNSQPGAGLGLALVRRICRRLGGEISVGDSPLGGARFTIALPLPARAQI